MIALLGRRDAENHAAERPLRLPVATCKAARLLPAGRSTHLAPEQLISPWYFKATPVGTAVARNIGYMA